MRGTLSYGIDIGLSRVMGGGGGDIVIPVVDIFTDSNIVRTFSEEVQPATVTNVGDGSGSYEVFNDTADAWVAGALSTSDNIQWTFNPTTDFTIGDSITLHLKDTILTVVGSNPYGGPFEVEYLVVNRLPTMDTFTIDTTSDDANIGILTATGTDLDGHALTFGVTLTDDSSTVALYQNEAAWQGSGFDTGLPEGTDETVTLYCFAKDSLGGISLVSISDTCAVDIPDVTAPVMTAFTVEPTSVVANIEIFTLAATDNVGPILYQVNEVATEPNPATGTWQSAAAWIAAGYDSSVTEGSPETVVLYAWAKDGAATPNISTSLTDSCDVTITHAPTFAVQPTVSTNGELYDGAKLDFTIADVNSDNVDIDYSINGADWTVLVTGITAANYAQTDVAVEGLAAGTITTLQLRVYDSGDTNYTESDAVASFDTVAPVLTSVTPGDTTNTLVFADNAKDTADSFNIHWGTTTGVLTNTIASVTSPYVHTGRTNDTEYFYEVVAIKGGLESTASAEDSGTPTVSGFFTDTFSTIDAATWDTAVTGAGSISAISGKMVVDTSSNVTDTAVANLRKPIQTDVDGRFVTQIIPSDFTQSAAVVSGPILQTSASELPAYNVANIIFWPSLINDGAGGAVSSVRMRYWNNVGVSRFWDDVAQGWAVTSKVGILIPGGEESDVWEFGVEIDDTNSRWRMFSKNVTDDVTYYTTYITNALTRSFLSTLYTSQFSSEVSATNSNIAKYTEVRYEAL